LRLGEKLGEGGGLSQQLEVIEGLDLGRRLAARSKGGDQFPVGCYQRQVALLPQQSAALVALPAGLGAQGFGLRPEIRCPGSGGLLEYQPQFSFR